MTTLNQTQYTTFKFNVKNSGYTVTIANGKSNYICVSKDMPRSRRASLGKYFNTFDEAIANYKNAEIKMQLLKIELGF